MDMNVKVYKIFTIISINISLSKFNLLFEAGERVMDTLTVYTTRPPLQHHHNHLLNLFHAQK